MKVKFGTTPVLTVIALTSFTEVYGIAEVALLPLPSFMKEKMMSEEVGTLSFFQEESDNFTTIGAIDSMVVGSMENLHVSISTATVFISTLEKNKVNDKNSFFIDESKMQPNSEYILRLKSVNVTNKKWYTPFRSLKNIGKKFKLLSVSSC